jgi:hypothetical protein
VGVLDVHQAVIIFGFELLNGFSFVINANRSPENPLLFEALLMNVKVTHEHLEDCGDALFANLLNEHLCT